MDDSESVLGLTLAELAFFLALRDAAADRCSWIPRTGR